MVNKIYNNAKTAHTKKTKENLLQLLEILKIWIMIDKLKIAIIVQAREESVRFPKKVLYPILGKPLIINILDRLKKSKLKNTIIVAIPKNKKNIDLERYLKKTNIKFLRDTKKMF